MICQTFRLTLALALVALASSCGIDNRQLRGGTSYLEGLTVPRPSGQSGNQPAEDTFSYWDDDGSGGAPHIRVDLSDQAAYFYRGQHLVGRSRISSGNETHATPAGNFHLMEKDPDHKSSVYGWIWDANGQVINNNADIRKDKVPPGGRWDPAKMTWFMQFYPATGMHAGYLPGYPASHGCIRMPEHMAKHFFDNIRVGDPVTIVR